MSCGRSSRHPRSALHVERFLRLKVTASETANRAYQDRADLVVEVISPNDLYADVDAKVDEYLLVGVKLVWVVNPFTKSLRIYRLDGTSQTLREDDELSGEDVVPGFRCRLTDFLTSLDDE